MLDRAMYRKRTPSRYPLLVGLLCNVILAMLKLGYGFFGYSELVLLDGLFSLMTAMVFLLAWQALVLQKGRPEEGRPYGLDKILFLSMAVVGCLGLTVAVHMFFYSAWTMGRVAIRGWSIGAMEVAAMSITANVVLYRYLGAQSSRHPDAVATLPVRMNRIGAWISFAVLLLLILAGLGGGYLERLGVAVIAIIVLILGIRMVYAAFAGIMDKVPPPMVLEGIRSCAQNVSEVKEVIKMRVRNLGTLLHICVWIAVDENLSMERAEGVARNVRTRLVEKIALAKEVDVIIA